MDQKLSQNRPALSRWRRYVLVLGGVAVLVFGIFMGRQTFSPAAAAPEEKVEPVTQMPAHLFKDWGVPEVALLLSGQTFGYLQPCGCSEPQFGGLVRRYNVVKLLEKKGWKVAGIDLGEIYPPKVELAEQAREKFKTTLRAMNVMNYQDFGLGIPEYKMPLINGLAEMLALNIKNPRPVSLDLKDPNQIYQNLSVRSYDVIDNGKTKVGVSGLVGPTVAKALQGEPGIDFFANAAIIPALLPALAKNNVDVVVLLVQGDAPEAEAIAKACFAERQKNPALPNVDLIVHTSPFDTPPARPQLVEGTNTRVIYMGHKGKDVGVLGLFRKAAGGFELKYELVSLGPQFATPKDQEAGHPVIQLMEEYAATVKQADFLERYKALRIDHPTQRALQNANVAAKFVGTDRCAECHPDAFKVWEKTGHSHAYQTLTTVKNPSLREFDPDCVACHTVGLKYRTGYYDPPAGAAPLKIADHNQKLLNVGCESCHGPGSMHANDPMNKAYHALINPIRSKDHPPGVFEQLLDRACQSCHDIENDVHWGAKKPFQQSWKRIVHPGVP